MPSTTLDAGALERAWAGLNLIDADRYKARVFRCAGMSVGASLVVAGS